MKKRIISLVLVIVMAAGLLVSCAYSFADDDMSNYASFDDAAFAAFKEALKSFTIEDGDFTSDGDMENGTRSKKFKDTIFKALADSGEKLYSGTAGDYDVIYYCYYAIYKDEDDKTVTLYTSKMKETAAVYVQLLSAMDEDSLEYKIKEQIKNHRFEGATDTSEGTNYHISTSDKKAVNGDVICITYTKTADGSSSGNTFTNKIVTIDEADGFLAQFIDKTPGDEITITDVTEGETTYKYTDVSFNWIQNAGTVYEVKHTYDTTKTETVMYEDTGDKKNVDIKDKELTFRIYPVYFKDVIEESELDWKQIVENIYGTSITGTTFNSFSKLDSDGKTELLKNDSGKTLAQLINGITDDENLKTSLKDLIKAKKEAATEYDSASEKYNDAVKKYEAAVKKYNDAYAAWESAAEGEDKTAAEKVKNEAETARTTAEKTQSDALTAKETAAEAKTKAETDFNTRMDLIEQIITANSLADKIVEEYKKLVFDGLETTYNKTIMVNVAKEIQTLINNIKVTSLPEKAVDEVYDIMMQNHKYTFYTGSYEENSQTITYYKENEGSFEKYLKGVMSVAETGTMKDAEAKVWEKAEAFVTELVKIYAVSEKYDCVLTDEEYEKLTYNEQFFVGSYYGIGDYQAQYGDIGYRAACQFAELYNKLLEIEGYDEALESYNTQYEENTDPNKVYDFDFDYYDENGMIRFTEIKYTKKAD